MINLKDFIGNSKLFKKFEVDDLLFTEFKCPIDEPKSSLWWDNNFFAYVMAGETRMITPRREYTVRAGECFFAKKGSVITYNHLQKEFCELLIFVPDDFIKSVMLKHKIPALETIDSGPDTLIPLEADNLLLTYFHSLLSYFPQPKPPPEELLKLKFEELIVNILSHGRHLMLKCYFSELCCQVRPSIKQIMDANFSSNLSLQEFSRLCARSLSTFKREFYKIYHTSPGKWLVKKRLELSRYLLKTTDDSIDEICFVTGFENRSHFNRVFKERYGHSPGKFRLLKKLNK